MRAGYRRKREAGARVAELTCMGVQASFPTRSELDLTLPDSINAALERYEPDVVVVHVAYTNAKRACMQAFLRWNMKFYAIINCSCLLCRDEIIRL